MTEPPSSYTAGVESTVYRGVLSEFLKEEFSSKEEAGLNPLYVVECFRRHNINNRRTAKEIVLIHCISWSAFGGIHT